MPKRLNKLEVCVCGIFDLLEKKLVKVSLEEEEIDTELSFMEEPRYNKCWFRIELEMD
jgi:hypothetical protein